MESPDMSNEKQVSLRLPVDVLDRAEGLVDRLASLPAFRAFRVERATVLRLAVLRGLDELERENAATTEAATQTEHQSTGRA